MSKNKKNRKGVVYSTDPEYDYDFDQEAHQETLEPAKQKLRIQRDSKRRRGKTVSLITGFVGTEDDLKALGKVLKTKCGVGGTAKDGEIVIQGDVKEKLATLLTKMGYKVKVI